MIAIFDLDGCLCDDRHRLHLLPSDSYDPYHERCVDDPPMNLELLQAAVAAGYGIVFNTARPEQYRVTTNCWLAQNVPMLPPDFHLYMRQEGLLSKESKVKHLREAEILPADVACAYDDRRDVLEAYIAYGIPASRCHLVDYPAKRGVSEILQAMAKTFEERNAVYKDNYLVTAKILGALFPDGVPADVVCRPEFHILVTKVSKLTRFVNTGLTHVDSIHDDAVYSAMIEHLIPK